MYTSARPEGGSCTLALAHFWDFTATYQSQYKDDPEHDTCPDNPSATHDKPLMTALANSPCVPDVGVPQPADVDAYRDAYYPGPVTGVTATRNADGEVTVGWSRYYGPTSAGLHTDYAVSYLARRATETCWYVIGAELAPYNSDGTGVLAELTPDSKTFAATAPAPASTEAVVYAVTVYTRALPNRPAAWPGAASAKVTLCDVTRVRLGTSRYRTRGEP